MIRQKHVFKREGTRTSDNGGTRVVTFDSNGDQAYILDLVDVSGTDTGDWWDPKPGEWEAFGRYWTENVLSVTDLHTNEVRNNPNL